MACDLQSAAEEEARLASMSADERKKYKQKQRKVCPAGLLSCICMPCLIYQCTLHQTQRRCSHACLMFCFACCASLGLKALTLTYKLQGASDLQLVGQAVPRPEEWCVAFRNALFADSSTQLLLVRRRKEPL